MKTRRVHKGRKTRRHTNKRHSRHTNKRPGGRRHTNKRHGRRHTNKRKSTKGGTSSYSVALQDGQQKLADANNAMRDIDPNLRKAQNKYNETMNKKCPPLDCVIDKQLLNKKISPENFKSFQKYLNAKLPFYKKLYKKLSEQDIIKCIDIFQTKCSAKADACVNIDYTQFDKNLSEDEVNELMEILKKKHNLSQSELEKCITDKQVKKGKIKNDPYALVSDSNESMFEERKQKSDPGNYGFKENSSTSLNSQNYIFNPKDRNYKFEFQGPHPGSNYDVDE